MEEKEKNSVILLPYAMHYASHRWKVHIINASANEETALCGFYHWAYAGILATHIDKEWIEQPDPDGFICKRCLKKAHKYF